MSDGADMSTLSFRWVGSEDAFLDAPALAECGSIIIGRYGGRTDAGARKNEDGALVWEYPRATPNGEQIDLVEVMELENGLIHRHRVYWGWYGVKTIEEDRYHR